MFSVPGSCSGSVRGSEFRVRGSIAFDASHLDHSIARAAPETSRTPQPEASRNARPTGAGTLRATLDRNLEAGTLRATLGRNLEAGTLRGTPNLNTNQEHR